VCKNKKQKSESVFCCGEHLVHYYGCTERMCWCSTQS